MNNYFGGNLPTLQRHQHAAAREWINEGRGVTNREQAAGRRQRSCSKAFQRNTEPLCVRAGAT